MVESRETQTKEKKGLDIIREPFEVKTEDGVKIFGCEKYLSNTPIKGTVLLLHPMSSLGHIYLDIPFKDYSFMDYLARHGFRAVGMDFRGFGGSDKPDWVTFEACGKDIEAVAAYIREKHGLSKMHVVASSFGAMAVTFFTEKHQESIDRLVLAGYMYKQLPGGPMVERMKKLVENGKYYVRDKPSLETGPELYDAEPGLLDAWAKLIEEKKPTRPITPFLDMEGRKKSPSYIPQISVPTLLVRGEHDLNSQEGILQCFKELRSKEKVFLEIGNAGHSLWREKAHRVLFMAILGWVNG